MLTIYTTTKYQKEASDIVHVVPRLDEVVAIKNLDRESISVTSDYLIIDDRGITVPLVWDHSAPPYLLDGPLSFQKDLLLSLVFHKLGNDEKAWTYTEENEALRLDYSNISCLKYGIENFIIPQEDDFRSWHNRAVMLHYGGGSTSEEIVSTYHEAHRRFENPEYLAFSKRELATLYVDQGMVTEAIAVVKSAIENALSEDAKHALQIVMIKAKMTQVTPQNVNLIEELKEKIWESLQYAEGKNDHIGSGQLLMDSSEIALHGKSYSEALGYIRRAIDLFENEGIEQLAASAQIKKGVLLYTWAKDGNPQFYKSSIEAYQEATKVFSKDATPHVFADIHHKLAIIYAEMPTDTKKRGIMAGVSSASFQEALAYYTKEDYPEVYGSICNNFGNALNAFPMAVHTDNREKALYYYQESLDVRSKDRPNEIAITLLNYVETCWKMSNPEENFNQERYDKMLLMATEAFEIAIDPQVREEAEKHLHNLKALTLIKDL